MREVFKNDLFKLKRNTIILAFDNAASAQSAGLTRFGGSPDVPDDFEWPVHEDDELSESYPINFLAQFDCRELSQYDAEGVLPTNGLLSFFYDAEGQPWEGKNEEGGSIRVFWFENADDLKPAEYPDDFEEESCFPCMQIKMHNEGSYPGWEDYDLIQQDMSREMRNEYCDIRENVAGEEKENASKLLGWADVKQDTMLRTCDELIYGEEREDEVILDDWQLLLQLSTVESDDFELMFADEGSIYFYILKNDLKNRNFDRVCMMLQGE